MAFEVTIQQLLSQANEFKGLYGITKNQKFKDQENRLRRVIVELQSFQNLGGSQNLQEVTDQGSTTTNPIDVGGITSNYVQLDTLATPVLQPGMFGWDDAFGTADLRLKGNNVTLQLGQEILARVVNKTGADLLESQYRVVRVRIASEGGAQGQRLAVVLAQGNNDPDSVTTLGIVTENIANNQEGFITILGNVNGINTTGSLQGETWVDGDVLYLSPTTPGALTKVKPTAPNHTVTIGYVVYAHATQGRIFVKVDNGYELDELHNVLISSPSSGQLLRYNGTVWENWNPNFLTTTPTLDQVTTAGNTTTNAITVGGLTVATDLIVTDVTNGRINFGGTTTSDSAVSFRFTKNSTTDARLGVYGSNKLGVYLGLVGNNAAIYAYNYTAGAAVPLILNGFGGNVLINTTTDAGYKLNVNGTTKNIQTRIDITPTVNTVALDVRGTGTPNDYFTISNATGGANDVFIPVFFYKGASYGYGGGTDRYPSGIYGGGFIAAVDDIDRSGGLGAGAAMHFNARNYTNNGALASRAWFSWGSYLTTSMVMFAGGNLGINTTTNAGYKLDVNGTIRSSGVITANGGTSTDWNTAFSWGDHSSAGYLISGPGWTGIISIPTNPIGQQNIDVQNGVIINVF